MLLERLRLVRSALVLLVLDLSLGTTWAQKESILHSFAGTPSDGATPQAGLVLDTKGNMYGTTFYGGTTNNCSSNGCGTVFKVAPSGKETAVYSFCPQSGCRDGALPAAALVLDASGNLYGTTLYGGASSNCQGGGCGTVFKVTPSGKETVLHSFAGSPDGALPGAALVLDAKGNLYGTTSGGGASGYAGTVFKVTPSGKETVLHSFAGSPDGASPGAALVLDAKGNLYGTTAYGGSNNKNGNCPWGCGVVFKVTPSGKEKVLFAFPDDSIPNGANPVAGVVLDAKGNIYGTTLYGGDGPCDDGVELGCGVVFRVTPSGTEKVLHNFCSRNACEDGIYPEAGLVLDVKGNLYGTTTSGGGHHWNGTVFKITPYGKETVLYSFQGPPDGGWPWALVLDTKGNMYGTTFYGGLVGFGTVFRVVP